mgnify:CR=1 FL=1
MASSTLDLASLFSAVTKNLSANQEALNQADSYNHNHGSNIVDIFQTITTAVKQKKGATPAEQLAYASASVRKSQTSGSGQFYADSLAKASQQLKGKKLDSSNAMDFVATLLGGTQQAPAESTQSAAGELLGTLLGGTQKSSDQAGGAADLLGALLGETQQGTVQSSTGQANAADMLGSLLGGLTGQQSSQTDGKLDINDLLTAGMSFMQSKARGASTLEAAVGAILAASPLGQSQHRSMSGNIIASTLLKKLTAGLVKQ